MKHARKNLRFTPVSGVLALLLAFSGCDVLQQMVNIRQPAIKAEKVRIRSLSFEAVDLVLDVGVTNPNQVGVSLTGFDYDFQIRGASLFKGDQASKQTIAAGAKSTLQIPVTLVFKDLYSAVQTLKNQDSAAYTLACGLAFDLPVLGRVRIPASHSGNLPMIKLPLFRLQSLKVKRMGYTGADLELAIGISNPNAFGFGLKKLDYSFAVNGMPWAKGISTESVLIGKKSDKSVRIPVSLNFVEMGRTVTQLLSGNKTLDYTLTGGLDVGTSIPALETASIPLDLAGKVSLTK
jgi:LEA14-like dessication related protein